MSPVFAMPLTEQPVWTRYTPSQRVPLSPSLINTPTSVSTPVTVRVAKIKNTDIAKKAFGNILHHPWGPKDRSTQAGRQVAYS